MYVIEPFDLQEIDKVSERLVRDEGANSVWLFEGQMGAGKTTLIKAICKYSGVLSTVQSPTFSIVNEYVTAGGETIYHFDCYRLKNTAEAYDIGLEEYLDSGNLCLIEWPEKIAELLPDRFVTLSIRETVNGKREITVTDNNDI